MLLIPNLGAEQPLVNSEQLDTLRPFVLQAMRNLVQSSKAQVSQSQPQALAGYDNSYLPAELLDELPADGLFAFINTTTWSTSREKKDVHSSAQQMLCRFIAETGSSSISRHRMTPG